MTHPDKVFALKRATFEFARAIRQARFTDAIPHQRAMRHLSADLRDERGERRGVRNRMLDYENQCPNGCFLALITRRFMAIDNCPECGAEIERANPAD